MNLFSIRRSMNCVGCCGNKRVASTYFPTGMLGLSVRRRLLLLALRLFAWIEDYLIRSDG